MTFSGLAQVDVRDYIRRKLETLAMENRVNLLFGIESGSRAWGFPLPTAITMSALSTAA